MMTLKKPLLLCLAILLLSTKIYGQKQGQKLIDSLLSVLPAIKGDTNRASLLNHIGNSLSSVDPDKAILYTNEALALSRKLGWNKGIAAASNVLGICYVYKSDNKQALQYWEEALTLFKKVGDKKGVLKIIGNIGVVHMSEGAYATALQNNFEALKYAEETGDEASIAINTGNIGTNYEFLKNYDKALEYDKKALRMFRAAGNRQSSAVFLGNIGNIYIDEKDYPTALRYEDSALTEDGALGNSEGIARDMSNLGSLYALIGDYPRAFDYYFNTLSLSRKTGLKSPEAKALNSIGDALLLIATDSASHLRQLYAQELAPKYDLPVGKESMLRTAMDYFRQSIAIDSATNNMGQLLNNYNSLSETQMRLGLFKESRESYRQYAALKDSVFSSEAKVKVANLETQRELELKDKQIIIDRLEVAKKRNERAFFIAGIVLLLAVAGFIFRNIRLRSAKELSENKLQTFQARMNPHFIFNSLNSIQSLMLNGDTVPSITYLSRFSKLMRQILDSSAKSKVVLKTELEMLRGYIELEQLRFDTFTYELSVAPEINLENILVPAMIIQPFVENAIIHGILPKKAEGRLSVTFEQKEGGIICTIDDNGIGRKRSAALNAERRKDHESHGISIASNRLALISKSAKGSVTYIDKEEGDTAAGTRVILQIPIL